MEVSRRARVLGVECAALGRHLPNMLDATLTTELFELEPDSDPVTELTGLGGLDRQSRRRVVRETLELVVPGLERYGIDAAPGRRWLLERIPRPPL